MSAEIEQDDFANDKEIQRIRNEAAALRKRIKESFEFLHTKIPLTPIDELPNEKLGNLDDFFLFRSLNNAQVEEAMSSANPDMLCNIYLVEYHSNYSAGRLHNAGDDLYFFGELAISKNYPSSMFYKENLVEKLTDLFKKQDVDFPEAKKFSSRFHVITEDREKLKYLLGSKPLDDLSGFEEMEVELYKNRCFFRLSRRNLLSEDIAAFANLAITLHKILR